jgi:hypothetical protein
MSLHVISCHFMSFHVISCHFMSFHVISCHCMSFHVISCHFMSFHVIACHCISFHVIGMSLMSLACHNQHSDAEGKRSIQFQNLAASTWVLCKTASRFEILYFITFLPFWKLQCRSKLATLLHVPNKCGDQMHAHRVESVSYMYISNPLLQIQSTAPKGRRTCVEYR